MKNIVFCCASILLLFFASCKDKSDKKKSASDNMDSETMFLAYLKISNNQTDTYQFNGTEFEIIDHKSMLSFYCEFSDGTFREKQDDDASWEKPDAEKGEYDKWIIEEINNQTAILRYECFKNNLKQKWRFHCEYTRGTYSDYMKGKTVELAFKADELDEYEASLGIASKIMLANQSRFDLKHSKATIKIEDNTIRLNKKSLINPTKVKMISEIYIVSELHDTFLEIMKSNLTS